VTWMHSCCSQCEFCLGGLENLCDQATFTGYDFNGGYGELVTAREEFTFLLPDNLSDIHTAPLLCAGVIGYRAYELSGIKPGGCLGLFGFGASAHLTLQIARFFDCRVFVFSRGLEHRKHARDLGAEWTGVVGENPPELCDACITFAPAGWVVPEALKVLKKNGTVAVNAVHMSPIPEFGYEALYFEKKIQSVTNCTRSNVTDFLELAARLPIQTDVEVAALEEANEILMRLKKSDVRGAFVLKLK